MLLFVLVPRLDPATSPDHGDQGFRLKPDVGGVVPCITFSFCTKHKNLTPMFFAQRHAELHEKLTLTYELSISNSSLRLLCRQKFGERHAKRWHPLAFAGSVADTSQGHLRRGCVEEAH
jgi:hypothetical protein